MTAASSYNPAFVTSHGGTVASAKAALFAGIRAGQSYFNIHTTTSGGGEIRGVLQSPDPARLPHDLPVPATGRHREVVCAVRSSRDGCPGRGSRSR